jgi:ubiquinone/menaquinone biosynthesis C-methylase UbiE
LNFTKLDVKNSITIADIGCGTGAQTFALAGHTKGHITAVDLFPEFLEKLNEKSASMGYEDRITTDVQSMDRLPYKRRSFDMMWSEGAIYIMGFQEGAKAWRKFLKNNGILVVSEISWFTESRPAELEEFWLKAYPQIDTVINKEKILKKAGYNVITSFRLPEYCWIENYYRPIQAHIPQFLEHNGNIKAAQDLVDELVEEIEMYEKYKEYYGYGFYIAQKV